MVQPQSQAAYTANSGISPTLVPVFSPTDPTSSSVNFPQGQQWINTVAGTVWELANFSTTNAQLSANWIQLGSNAGAIFTLTGDTGGAISPVNSNIDLVGGSGLNTTGTAGTITFNLTGGGFEFTEVTADTQMAVNQGYIANKAGTICELTLPATAAVGDAVAILGKSATLWLIAQNAGQTIHMNAESTTTGAAGSVSAIDQYNSIQLICITADTDWIVQSCVGILTLT